MAQLRFFYSLLFIGFLSVFMGLIPNQVNAQSGQIRGIVVDQQSGEELPGASVLIQGTSKGSATNMDGEYVIYNVKAGEHVLVVSYVGYQKKEINVTLESGEKLKRDIELLPVGVEGEEVIVSAQARGQNEAINQQISNLSISNVVSADRLNEVPDANAAESIGRLPGISIQRSGGEASKVAIRGLSPKFNAINIDGVRMAGTDPNNRSVDLSMISPDMLSGIEVTKANLPDQDADAIGGTVNLQMREAKSGFHTDVKLKGGYNEVGSTFENYKIGGNVSNRFFDEHLGVIVNFNAERRDRSVDKYNAGYELRRENDELVPSVSNVTVNENTQTRTRLGGSVLMDYQLPNGKISFNNFFSARENDGFTRKDKLNPRGNQNRNIQSDIYEDWLTVQTHTLAAENDFGLFSADVMASLSRSRNFSPDNVHYNFVETPAFSVSEIDYSDPATIPEATIDSLNNTVLSGLNENERKTLEETWNFEANFDVPFSISNDINGQIKFGGKYMNRYRNRDKEAWGTGIMHGAGAPARRLIYKQIPQLLPEEAQEGYSGRIRLSNDYLREEGVTRDGFLKEMPGDWAISHSANLDVLNRMRDILKNPQQYDPDGEHPQNYFTLNIGNTFGDDYEGTEDLMAGYAMAEIDLGSKIKLIPGFRYERMRTDFNAMVVNQRLVPRQESAIGDRDNIRGIEENNAVRENDFILPMYHINIQPADWLKIRLARTNTITRPDFSQYSPRVSIGGNKQNVYAGNRNLEPAEALNHDVSVSVKTNEIGLFTVAAFHKKIEKLIWRANFPDLETEEGSKLMRFDDIPWVDDLTGTPQIHTSLNNDNPAYYRGIEVDWQSNFWWLPSPFDGVVLNANIAYIDSETKFTQFKTRNVPVEGSIFPKTVVYDTNRTARMPDQPNYTANVSLGYDYKGFSSRIALLYQGETLSWVGDNEASDFFTEEYLRLDARVQQKIGNGFEVFTNLNNINSRPDRNFRAVIGKFPSSYENYGFTAELGVRYRY